MMMDPTVSSYVEVQVLDTINMHDVGDGDVDDDDDVVGGVHRVMVPVTVVTADQLELLQQHHHHQQTQTQIVEKEVIIETVAGVADDEQQESVEQQTEPLVAGTVAANTSNQPNDQSAATKIYNRKGQVVATLMDDDLEFYQFLVKHFEPKRSVWMRSEFKSRDLDGEFATLFPKLEQDPENFRHHLGVHPHTFHLILDAIKPMIEKTSHFRKCISPEHRLYVTLKFLLLGTKFRTLENQLHVSHQSISKIVVETSRVIYQVLRKRYIPFPSVEQFEEIAKDFQEKSNFPHCLGAVDAKHIRISSPVNKNPRFKHYRGHFFVRVQGVCDSNYRFTCVDVGAYAADNPDGGQFSSTTFGEKLLNQTIPIPEPRPLQQTCTRNDPVPYVWVADQNFPLHPNLMRPYGDRRGITAEEKTMFNERLAYAQRYIEYTFGILYHKWNCLNVKLDMLPTNVDQVILACCVLHNAIIEHEGMPYTDEEMEDMRTKYVESKNRAENNLTRTAAAATAAEQQNSSGEAKSVRENFFNYFLGAGSLEDQYQVYPEYMVTTQNLI